MYTERITAKTMLVIQVADFIKLSSPEESIIKILHSHMYT